MLQSTPKEETIFQSENWNVRDLFLSSSLLFQNYTRFQNVHRNE